MFSKGPRGFPGPNGASGAPGPAGKPGKAASPASHLSPVLDLDDLPLDSYTLINDTTAAASRSGGQTTTKFCRCKRGPIVCHFQFYTKLNQSITLILK